MSRARWLELTEVYMSDAQDLAVHVSITTVKVKDIASDPELEGIGPYMVQGLGLSFMVISYHGEHSLDGLSILGTASFPLIHHYPYFSTFK